MHNKTKTNTEPPQPMGSTPTHIITALEWTASYATARLKCILLARCTLEASVIETQI